MVWVVMCGARLGAALAGRVGSRGGPRQVCLKSGDATAGFGMLHEKRAALVQAVCGAQGGSQCIALGHVAFKASGQDLKAGGGDGHVQNRLRAGRGGSSRLLSPNNTP